MKRSLALTAGVVAVALYLFGFGLGAINADGKFAQLAHEEPAAAATSETSASESDVAVPVVVPTTTTIPLPPVTLAENGLDVASFGTRMDAVVEALTARYGAGVEQNHVTCTDGTTRILDFRGLAVLFGPGSKFTGYGYTELRDPLGLSVDNGVHVGTTVAELRSIYGDRLVVDEKGTTFTAAGLYGGLVDDAVVAIGAGATCT